MKKCIILFSNLQFLKNCKKTIEEIRTIGKYEDDIVLVIGDDLKDASFSDFSELNIIVKHFKDKDRTEIVEILKKKPIFDGREVTKIFQWHKLYCFDVFFKQWDICFYIDSGMHIFKPLDKFFELDCTNSLLAHSDSYPTYQTILFDQFNQPQFPELFDELNKKYDLNIDYFQSGIMMYDTSIIENDTYDKLNSLGYTYINSKTNEQGILNLYFNCEKNIWKQIKIKDDETYFYDYWERQNFKYSDYIMLKYPRTI